MTQRKKTLLCYLCVELTHLFLSTEISKCDIASFLIFRFFKKEICFLPSFLIKSLKFWMKIEIKIEEKNLFLCYFDIDEKNFVLLRGCCCYGLASTMILQKSHYFRNGTHSVWVWFVFNCWLAQNIRAYSIHHFYYWYVFYDYMTVRHVSFLALTVIRFFFFYSLFVVGWCCSTQLNHNSIEQRDFQLKVNVRPARLTSCVSFDRLEARITMRKASTKENKCLWYECVSNLKLVQSVVSTLAFVCVCVLLSIRYAMTHFFS